MRTCNRLQRSLGSCLLLTFGAVAPHLAAAEERGPYATLLGGIGWLGDTDVTGTGVDAEAEFDPGFGAGGAVGWDFGAWRLEGELMYRTNDSDGLSGGVPAGWEGGDFSSLGLGFNGIYEFELGGSPAVTGYIGAGVVWFQEIDIDFATPAGERSFSGDDVALQTFVGARYRFTSRWSAAAEVRYLGAGSVSLDGEGAAAGKLEADYDRTSLVLGLSYRF